MRSTLRCTRRMRWGCAGGVFAGTANFPGANLRHYAFLNRGLVDVAEDLAQRHIGFVLRNAPHESQVQFFTQVKAALVVGDENPMRGPEGWRREIAANINIPFWTVDADVVVPSKLIEKAQYGAYTIRPRLYRMLPEFVVPFENPNAEKEWRHPATLFADDVRDDMTRGWKNLDRTVKPVAAWTGGHHAAMKRLDHFCGTLLKNYERDRNRPEVDGTSMLSPYLHFGHIGPVTIALAVNAAAAKDKALVPRGMRTSTS